MPHNRMKYRFLCVLFALGTAFLLTAPKVRVAAEATADCIFIDSRHYYNPTEGLYVYTIEQLNNAEIYSSVTDGMITNGPVTLNHQMMVSMEVLKDGALIDMPADGILSEAGEYIVRALGNDVSYDVLRFTIPKRYRSLTSYRIPDGCKFTNVTCNDSNVGYDGRVVYFSEDGEYHVEYMDTYSDRSYMFDMIIDTVPPTLPLEGVEDGIANGSVSLLGGEAGTTLYIEQDGRPYTPAGNELTEAANYYVKISDEAGNYSEYLFTIKIHVDALTILFIVLVLLVLAALTVILLNERRRMRIR